VNYAKTHIENDKLNDSPQDGQPALAATLD